jgi:phosphate transport system substrate-binding protein
MKKYMLSTAAAAIAMAAAVGSAAARDQIQIAGSSTVLPYAKIVAEQFGETYTNFKTPVVESGGSGAGIKEFCKGVGETTIDIANSSRKMKEDEVKSCVDAGVKEIQEVKIGYDGIVFATDAKGPDFALTAEDVYKALAAKVAVDGQARRQSEHQVEPGQSGAPRLGHRRLHPGREARHPRGLRGEAADRRLQGAQGRGSR